MHNRNRDADTYPTFSAGTSDAPQLAASADNRAPMQRSSSYDHDIEHTPIAFSPQTLNENAWANSMDDDDSPVTFDSSPSAFMQAAAIEDESTTGAVLPPTAARHGQRTPAAPQRLRWLRIIVGSALCVALAAAAGWVIIELRDPATLPLKSVRIEGAFTHVTTEGLQQAIAGAAGGGFLYADVDALRQAALQVPWVRSVSVRRVWPDTLHVSITEHAAAARWGDQALLSSEAKVFAPEVASYPADLPELHGPVGTQATVLAQYRDMNKAIAPLNLHIKRLDLDARRAWRLSLDNGIELLLGRADSNAHLQRFVRVYPSLLAAPPADSSIARVDMRYGNGLAVRWSKTQS